MQQHAIMREKIEEFLQAAKARRIKVITYAFA
jgi:hypothetical protein